MSLRSKTKKKNMLIRKTNNLGPSLIGIIHVARSEHKPNPSPPVAISKTMSKGYAKIKIREKSIKKTIVRNKNIFFLF